MTFTVRSALRLRRTIRSRVAFPCFRAISKRFAVRRTPCSARDAGADVIINNGTIIGGIHADNNARIAIKNVYVAGNTVENTNTSSRLASIFGEGSLTMIVAILALATSVASICLTVAFNKKKAVLGAANNTAENEGED